MIAFCVFLPAPTAKIPLLEQEGSSSLRLRKDGTRAISKTSTRCFYRLQANVSRQFVPGNAFVVEMQAAKSAKGKRGKKQRENSAVQKTEAAPTVTKVEVIEEVVTPPVMVVEDFPSPVTEAEVDEAEVEEEEDEPEEVRNETEDDEPDVIEELKEEFGEEFNEDELFLLKKISETPREGDLPAKKMGIRTDRELELLDMLKTDLGLEEQEEEEEEVGPDRSVLQAIIFLVVFGTLSFLGYSIFQGLVPSTPTA